MGACFHALHKIYRQELSTWLFQKEGLLLSTLVKLWIFLLCKYTAYISYFRPLGRTPAQEVLLYEIHNQPDFKGMLQISFILELYTMRLYVQSLLQVRQQSR